MLCSDGRADHRNGKADRQILFLIQELSAQTFELC